MANYQSLKAAINAVIKANGNKEITGTVLNEVLLAMVNSLGAGYQFAGVATPDTNPGTPDQNVFYIAGKGGTYTNFNSIVLPNGVSILKWNGSWSSETVVAGDCVFDISAYKATGGTLATFADLTAAIDGGNNIPQPLRKGGMSVKFVQSSDNKYVQYRLTSNVWSGNISDWYNSEDNLYVLSGIVPTSILEYKKGYYLDSGIPTGGGSTQHRGATFNYIPLVSPCTLSIALKGNYLVVVTYYSSNSESSYIDNTSYEPSGDFKIPQNAKFARFTFRLADNSTVSENIDDIVSKIEISNYLDIDSTNEAIRELSLKKFADSESYLNLTNLEVIPQSTLLDTGKIDSHLYRNTFKPIMVAPFSTIRIQRTNTNIRSFRVCLYRRYKDNSSFDLSYYASSEQPFDIITKGDELYMIVTVLPEGDVLYTPEQIKQWMNIYVNSSFVNIPPFEKIEYLFDKERAVILNDYTSEWRQGRYQGTILDNRIEHLKPIAVLPGHRYMLWWSYESNVKRVEVNVGDDERTSERLGWYNNSYGSVFSCPKNAKFLRLTLGGWDNTYTITPADAEPANVVIIDVTTPDYHIPSCYELLQENNSNSRYAQGIAISNGYIFQAFSDGTIDIFSINSNEKVATVALPIPRGEVNVLHANNIYFGEKYDSNDKFGLLWVSSNDIGTKMLAVRIAQNDNNFIFTTAYEVDAPTIDDSLYNSPTQLWDFKNKKMVQYCYNNYNNDRGDIHIFVYSVDEWTDSATFTLIKDFAINKLWATQGGILADNKLYLISSIYAKLSCLNVDSENIDFSVDFSEGSAYAIRNEQEVQGIALYDGKLYLPTTEWLTYAVESLYKLYQITI